MLLQQVQNKHCGLDFSTIGSLHFNTNGHVSVYLTGLMSKKMQPYLPLKVWSTINNIISVSKYKGMLDLSIHNYKLSIMNYNYIWSTHFYSLVFWRILCKYYKILSSLTLIEGYQRSLLCHIYVQVMKLISVRYKTKNKSMYNCNKDQS